jgi:hypothetical protein
VPDKKTVKGWVKRARYYQEQNSIVLALEEVESRRPLKPLQVSVTTFMNMGIQASKDDHDAWRFFAEALEKRTAPITIEFEGTKTAEDPI